VDPAQLEQALLNALINARDAVADADAPRVTLTVDVVAEGAAELGVCAGDYVRVQIADNGVGMDPATVSRIFEPFFTTKPVGKGTGLGLATTRAIVLEHGGFVTCDSVLRQGATFSFYLPSESGAAETPRPEAAPISVRGTETVFIVDNEPLIRRLVGRVLTAAGFTALLAASGNEALELVGDAAVASKIALVILDVSMPGMSGRELRSRIRELMPRARVVYFSGYAFDAPDATDSVLEKPTTEARLLTTVREALDTPAPRDA
jgi:two-component system, cell cycle sensor histidine kinase and response regulator CckA